MIIDSLELNNFRNYEALSLALDPKTNILFGNNAQGKTNILESLYLCSTSKSHRSSHDKEMIRFGCEEGHVRVKLRKKGIPYMIDIHLKSYGSKGIAINGVPIRKVSELFGLLNVVCFSPEDLNIIKGGPAVRRKFMDVELCQLDHIYVSDIINYNKVLLQKNKLLKEIAYKKDWEDTLNVWDEQLIRYGERIIDMRRRFVSDLNVIIEEIHGRLSGGKEAASVRYEASFPECRREEEIRQHTTLSGPHRDDIAILLNGIDTRKFGSQGQQRTAALSLKLAEIELVRRACGDDPVLLLDDVLSELDEHRQNHLLSGIKDLQTVITCTGVEDFLNNNYILNKALHVEEGKVTEVLLTEERE